MFKTKRRADAVLVVIVACLLLGPNLILADIIKNGDFEKYDDNYMPLSWQLNKWGEKSPEIIGTIILDKDPAIRGKVFCILFPQDSKAYCCGLWQRIGDIKDIDLAKKLVLTFKYKANMADPSKLDEWYKFACKVENQCGSGSPCIIYPYKVMADNKWHSERWVFDLAQMKGATQFNVELSFGYTFSEGDKIYFAEIKAEYE